MDLRNIPTLDIQGYKKCHLLESEHVRQILIQIEYVEALLFLLAWHLQEEVEWPLWRRELLKKDNKAQSHLVPHVFLTALNVPSSRVNIGCSSVKTPLKFVFVLEHFEVLVPLNKALNEREQISQQKLLPFFLNLGVHKQP